jgi:hypothetical protein
VHLDLTRRSPFDRVLNEREIRAGDMMCERAATGSPTHGGFSQSGTRRRRRLTGSFCSRGRSGLARYSESRRAPSKTPQRTSVDGMRLARLPRRRGACRLDGAAMAWSLELAQ